MKKRADDAGVVVVEHEVIAELLENEWYLVRDSGELPETAFHASLHYLETDPDGPHLQLDTAQRQFLFSAAQERFEEIILRDLDFTARKSPAARGLGRAIINCQRFATFCRRQQQQELFAASVGDKLCPALQRFLLAARDFPGTVVHCSIEELESFAAQLGASLPAEVQQFLVFSC